jgi:hypothetical protein
MIYNTNISIKNKKNQLGPAKVYRMEGKWCRRLRLHCLFANAKFREDIIQLLIMRNGSGNAAQVM